MLFEVTLLISRLKKGRKKGATRDRVAVFRKFMHVRPQTIIYSVASFHPSLLLTSDKRRRPENIISD
jgi:uracil-DNA glycosylase